MITATLKLTAGFLIGGLGFTLGCLANNESPSTVQNNFNHRMQLDAAIEEAKLLGGDVVADDFFGYAVSLSGNRAVVGAHYHAAATDNEGAVYVFEFENNDWVQVQKLTADDADINDQFGQAVSIDGDRIMVGAFRDDDNSGDSGAVYVFDFDGSQWLQSQKLIAADGANSDWFGFAISLQGNRAAIAANHDNDLGNNSGSVYIFEFNGTTWVEGQKLLASDGAEQDKFGQAVSLSGDRLLVGAYFHQVNAAALGAAYVFDYDNTSNGWVESQKLMSNEGVDEGYFGYAVSLSGDRALVGAWRDTGNVSFSGAAYLFDFDGQAWSQSRRFTEADMNTGGQYGAAVSLVGDRALVGARKENANGTYSGAAYVYDWIAGEWSLTEKLLGADSNARDEFGVAVSLTGGKALVGAYRDAELGNNSGSAYVLNVPFKADLTVTGLAAGNTLELMNLGGDALVVSDNGGATFETPMFVGADYAVTVSMQPTSPNQTCLVNQGVGVVTDFGVAEINVVCVTNPYFVAGVVNNLLPGNELVLNNNGTEDLVVAAADTFAFSTPVDDHQPYEVTIKTMPNNPIQPCVVVNGTGTIQGDDVDNLVIDCELGTDLISRFGFE